MAFTKLESDVKNISKLPNEPSLEDGYTAKVLKELFDKASQDIKDYINNILLSELGSADAAKNIGAQDISGQGAEGNLHAQIYAIKNALDKIKAGGVDDGSITDEKLSENVVDILAFLGHQSQIFLTPGKHTFTAPRAGNYKITLVGGGSRGCSNGGGMSGAVSIAWRKLMDTKTYTFTVGAGGNAQTLKGGDSVFEDITAQGGFAAGTAYRSYCQATGGDINISGKASTIELLSNTVERAGGGDSMYGRGSRYPEEPAGIGAGGYGMGTTVNDGGDGAVIIEYIGI